VPLTLAVPLKCYNRLFIFIFTLDATQTLKLNSLKFSHATVSCSLHCCSCDIMYSAACFITYQTAWYHNPDDWDLSIYTPLWKPLISLHYVTGIQENAEILVRNSHVFTMQCIFPVWFMSDWSKWQAWDPHGRIPSSYLRSDLV